MKSRDELSDAAGVVPELGAGVPSRIGRYEVLGRLATGGMAQIYLARQTGLGSFERHVVLKTILRDRARDQQFVNMFLDEARLAATLNHGNVAQVYEVDQVDGAYFMAMEYVHGENARAILETSLKRGWTVPLELAVLIISAAAAGLHHAHERHGKQGQRLNIVHRDVSPANIMVGYDGSVKVLDFGIAKAEERATKTIGGTIKGKYGYMSPEQCKGKTIDRRSDIFALGIVLYELTTLRRAFKGNDDFDTMKRIVAGELVRPSVAVPGYPAELESIVLTALATDPTARYQTCQALIEALDAFAMDAKLTGSNTAMARFMVQLFGTKKEPWVDGGERVESADPSDTEKTSVAPRPSHASLASPGSVNAPAMADVAAWGGDVHERPQRPSSPIRERPLAPPAVATGSAPPTAVESIGETTAPEPPGTVPAEQLLGGIEISEIGAQPLVDDPKLGWETSVGNKRINADAGGVTRLASEVSEIERERDRASFWLIVAVVAIVVVAGAVAAIVFAT